MVRSERYLALLASTALALSAAPALATDLLQGNSLIISTTTYPDVGSVANLVAGSSSLPGKTAGSSAFAVSDGSLNTVWNNGTVDSAFGVSSAITISSVNPTTGKTITSEQLDPSLVSTSFASKSELGLNLTQTATGSVLTLMGYQGGGVGNIDVSNSDTTAYKDTTNPVTTFFAPNANQTYAFNRSVVAVSQNGSYTVTPTLAYGGNNGRAAVLANGNYYTVGNSNNGSGTPTQLTTSTGLEVVTPNAPANSQMINPNYSSVSGDKAGKDSNFRGLTQYNGNLYFTKGSGSNGIDTVYTVSNPGGALPTAATANSAVISVLPGFSTSSAKTAPDYTPFGLFFANSTTLYVADEGSGDALDVSTHAGLEKWTLTNGVWQLDYTLKSGLIGQTYSVTGWNYQETTVGLRNLTGKVNANGTVTLFATTATTSGSGDNGADPNEIVDITDLLSSTTLPNNEAFSVLDGPVAGLRYGGVAYAAPEASTWAMLILGFAGLGFMGYRKGRAAKAATARLA